MLETLKKWRFRISRTWQNRLVAILLVLAGACGIATYTALTETAPLGKDTDTVIWLLNIDFIILLALVALITTRIVGLWSGRRRGLAGSHLHVRLVFTFCILAAAPAIIMTIFAAVFFHFGVQTWFIQRVQTAVYESQAVAEAYLEEHQQVIRADTWAMANDIDRQARYFIVNEEALEQIVQTQSLFRNFSEAIVFTKSRTILARAGLTFALEFEDVPPYAIREADAGEVSVMTGGNDDRVRALIKLRNMEDTYLYVGRMVDPRVLSHVASTREASKDYADLQSRYSGLQVISTLIFVVMGLFLMMMAIWFGLVLARQLVEPITNLIKTADRVRAGDMTARVLEQDKIKEFQYLAQSFNRMTKQIEQQQSELITANRMMDERRRFTEAVLAGVSSGVLGMDAGGRITLANNAACKLLEKTEAEIIHQDMVFILPELQDFINKAHKNYDTTHQTEVHFKGSSGRQKTFLLRLAIERDEKIETGAVITFDDISELQAAQRKAAWSDVARRIAHEMKNPLTPIQLSAERLRRKYLPQITEGADIFSQCTDTIVKNVEDIGRMVNEFSNFARMPEPVMAQENFVSHITDTLSLHKNAHPAIDFMFVNTTGEDSVYGDFDHRQIRQAINNLVQNSIDSIHIRQKETPAQKSEKGHVWIVLSKSDDKQEINILISDDGIGLPVGEPVEKLTEPYVTHKPRGTGLGLAIVKKIMDDHGGRLVISPPKESLHSGFHQEISDMDKIKTTIMMVFPALEFLSPETKTATVTKRKTGKITSSKSK